MVDDTLTIKLLVTGLFFVVINLFLAYAVLRSRHRDGHRAAYEPENRKLERWLIGITTVGIAALLAPGLGSFGNYMIPLMVGARDMVFPYHNMLSF